MKYQKILEDTGFTRAQALVYLEILHQGQTKVGFVIKKTGLQSSVVHNAINQLIDMGMLNFVLIGKIKYYDVADPGVIVNYVQKQQRELEKKKKQIDSILPELAAIKKEQEKETQVEVFSGKKGFATAYLEEYNKTKRGQVARFIGIPEEYQEDEEMHNIFVKINDIAVKRGVEIRGLGPKGVKNIWKEHYKHPLYKMRYMQDDLPFGINVLGDSIIIAIWGDDPIVVKIKNKVYFKNTLAYFERKWKEAK